MDDSYGWYDRSQDLGGFGTSPVQGICWEYKGDYMCEMIEELRKLEKRYIEDVAEAKARMEQLMSTHMAYCEMMKQAYDNKRNAEMALGDLVCKIKLLEFKKGKE